MQVMPSVGPCNGGCGKTIRYSRKPKALGLCATCLADPAIKSRHVEMRRQMTAYMDEQIRDFGTWDPKVGGYRMAPGAFGMGKPRKAKR